MRYNRRNHVIIGVVLPELPIPDLFIPVGICLPSPSALLELGPDINFSSVLWSALDRSPLAHLPALARTGAQSSSALVCAFS